MEQKEELIRCKFCGELIPAESLKCPACGERLKIDLKNIGKVSAITFGVVALLTSLTLLIEAPRKVDLPKEELSSLEEGIELFNKGEYSEAEEMLNKAIEENKDPKAYFYLGKIKEHDNDMADAIYNYQESLRLNPLDKQLKPYLVNLCIDEGDNSCISEFIDQAYAEEPSNPKIALQYAISENLSQEEMFNILRRIPSTSTTEYYYANAIMGYSYYKNDEYKLAIPYLQRAYKLRDKVVKNDSVENYMDNAYDLSYTDERYMLAVSYVELEQYSNAIKILDDMIAKSGDTDLIKLKKKAVQLRDQYNYRKNYESQQQYNVPNYSTQRSSSSSKGDTTINGVKLKSKIISSPYTTTPSGDWNNYMNTLERRIKPNWNPPRSNESYKIIVHLVVGKDGDLISHYIKQSSGMPAFDRAAMSAVEVSTLPELPYWFNGSSVPIDFSFTYN